MQKHIKITSFKNSLKTVLDKYENSASDIKSDIENATKNPSTGDKYPGFGIDIYKLRFPIKKYKIGKSGGIRLIILLTNDYVSPLLIYYKRQFKETEIVDRIKTALKEFIAEVKNI